MNKYLKKGLFFLIPGIALNILGYIIKENEWGYYGWSMIIGTVLFGIGFLFVFYSFVRKVEYRGLIEEREAEAERKARMKAQKPRKQSLQMH